MLAGGQGATSRARRRIEVALFDAERSLELPASLRLHRPDVAAQVLLDPAADRLDRLTVCILAGEPAREREDLDAAHRRLEAFGQIEDVPF